MNRIPTASYPRCEDAKFNSLRRSFYLMDIEGNGAERIYFAL